MTELECQTCHGLVPPTRFCVRCGSRPSGPGRARYAAFPGERKLVPWFTSSLFPQLPPSSLLAFRVALVLGLALVVVAWLGSAYPLAVVLAATVVPAVALVYVYDVDVYEDARLKAVAFTAVWGVAAGIAVALAARTLQGPTDVLSRSGAESLLFEGFAIPLAGFVLAIAGPLLLLTDRRFDDVLDGATFGIASGGWLSAAALITSSGALFSGGLRPGGSAEGWALRVLALGIAGPVLWAAVVGALAGTIWLRYRAPVRNRRALGFFGHPVVAFALAGSAIVAAAVVQLTLSPLVAVVVLLVLALAALVWLRNCIHTGLFEEAGEGDVGPDMSCASCGVETPGHAFCGNCGIARRALPKVLRKRDEGSGEVAGTAPARLVNVLVPVATAAGLLVLVGVAAAAVLIAAPSTPEALCDVGDPCGEPPTSSPLLERATPWEDGSDFAVAYDLDRWRVDTSGPERLALVRRDGDAWVELSSGRDLAADPAIAQAGGVRIRAIEPIANPLHSPSIGYVQGAGRWYVGFLDSPQGVRDTVTIAALAAKRRDTTIRMTALFASTADELFGSKRALRAEVDSILNTVRWRRVEQPKTQSAGLPSPSRPTRAHAAGAVRTGRTPPATRIDFSITLAFPGLRKLERHAAAARPFLDAATIGARFGLRPRALRRVVDHLEGGGLRVISVNPQRTAIRVSGSAAHVNRLFDVTLTEFAAADGTRFRRPDAPLRVPRALRGLVDSALGLDTEPLPPEPVAPVAVGGSGLLPDDVAQAYDLLPLWERGIRGRGQTVAIVSLDSFRHRDIEQFDRIADSGAVSRVERVHVGGKPVPLGDSSLEVSLDIEIIRGLAPEARIINYEAPLSWEGFVEALRRVNADGHADLVSVSWGKCFPRVPADVVAAMEREHMIAVAGGRTTFVASGDSGAFSCLHSESEREASNHERAVDWPAASPNVVGVGGTRLSLRADGSYFTENAWEDVLSNRASGGGISPLHARPGWQRGPGVENRQSTGKRQVPDVAGPADCDSAFLVVYPVRSPTREGWSQATGPEGCGTSAAAPFWTAVAALVRQYAETRGVAKVGFLAPILYDLARRPGGRELFRDVQTGGNLDLSATRGWDYATGLGTPRAWNLARALTQRAKADG